MKEQYSSRPGGGVSSEGGRDVTGAQGVRAAAAPGALPLTGAATPSPVLLGLLSARLLGLCWVLWVSDGRHSLRLIHAGTPSQSCCCTARSFIGNRALNW